LNRLAKLLSVGSACLLRKPFLRLLSLFVGRMFHGGSELGDNDLDLGIGITAVLLAMPFLSSFSKNTARSSVSFAATENSTRLKPQYLTNTSSSSFRWPLLE